MNEEDRIVKVVGMKVQGRLTTWKAARRKKLLAGYIGMEQHIPHSLQRSVYDVFPSPTNLFGGYQKTHVSVSVYRLCNSRAHNLFIVVFIIFKMPFKALQDGQYTCRHDEILLIFADCLEKVRRRQNVRSKCQS